MVFRCYAALSITLDECGLMVEGLASEVGRHNSLGPKIGVLTKQMQEGLNFLKYFEYCSGKYWPCPYFSESIYRMSEEYMYSDHQVIIFHKERRTGVKHIKKTAAAGWISKKLHK